MKRSKRAAIVLVVIAALAATLALAACASPNTSGSTSAQSSGETTASSSEASQSADAGASEKAATPTGFSDFTVPDTGLFPDTEWNKRYLNAGNRGCNSCHESLQTVVENSGLVADHPVPLAGFANSRNVTILDGCLSCHAVHSADYGNYFADAIHSVHYQNRGFTETMGGNCWTCHAINDAAGITEIGTTDWVLWEQVMYEGGLGGFPDTVANPLTREFLRQLGHESGFVTDVSATEEPKIDVELHQDLTDLSDRFICLNHSGLHNEDDLFDPSHTVTVSGVNKPREFTLKDLQGMKQTTKRATAQCAVAGSAGHNIYNAEYEGVLLADIIEACGGLVEGSNQVSVTGWDEWECANIAWPLTNYADALIALKMDGEDLTYEFGGPMCLIIPGAPSGPWCKFVKTIEFSKGEPIDLVGALYQNVPGDVLPAVSAAWFENDGLEFKLGEEVKLTGYGYAFSKSVAPLARLEFSTDLGVTWVPVEVPADFDPNQWVNFEFSWTPETAGTHIIKVRGVNTEDYLSNIDGSIIVTVTE